MRYVNTGKVKKNGVVYTPGAMADYLAAEMLKYKSCPSNHVIRILDPAAGKGELLISIINAIKSKSLTQMEVVGYETDQTVCQNTQALLVQLFPDISIKIKNEDFLEAVNNDSTGTFDYIIANPPYIRTQLLGSEKAQELSKKLKLSGRIDIYYAFLLYTKKVLNSDGIAGYITSNKFLTIKSGAAVRNFIVDNYNLWSITDFGDTKLFSASVLPCIIIFSNGKTENASSVRFTSIYETSTSEINGKVSNIFEAIYNSGRFEMDDGKIYDFQQGTLQSIEKGALWNIHSSATQEWLQKIESHTWKRFSDIGKIRVGIKTTADNVFIGENWTGEKSKIELLKPLITHRNAGQIVPNDSKQWQVLYTHTSVNGQKTAVDLEKYPYAKKYLMSHFEQLSNRKYIEKAHRNWYEIWVPQNPNAWQHRKIVFRDISEHPQFWLDTTGAIVNGDCYWIDINDDVVEDVIYLALAIANSRFIEKYYDIKFNTKLYSGKRRYMSQYVEQFPIPEYSSKLAQQAIKLVKKIIAEKDKKTFLGYKEKIDEIVERLFI